mmetsp:Transcript_7842/g.28663  ORF Transcript_7842/g.28663 Transcript_7842/m.28663 type:complete len:526 (+) Transcript_7842:2205-3782(+)
MPRGVAAAPRSLHHKTHGAGPQHFDLSPRGEPNSCGGPRTPPSSEPRQGSWSECVGGGMEAIPSVATTAGQVGGTPREPQLMSLLATQDLMTNSSCSSSTPYIFGHKLRQRQFDTVEHAREALELARQAVGGAGSLGGGLGGGLRGRARGDREDGEITSASESDSTRSWDFRNMRPSSLLSPPGAGSAWRQMSPTFRSPTPLARGVRDRDDGRTPASNDQQKRPEDPGGLLTLLGEAQLRAARQLAALLLVVVLVRVIVCRSIAACGLGPALAPSLLAGLHTGAVGLAYRASVQALSVGQMMETETNWGHRSVSLRIGGPRCTLCTFEFTLEEAFGCTCVLAQLTFFFFFENWGLYGPQACRWAAVVGHAGCAGIFTFAAHSMLARHVYTAPGSDAVGVLWLCLAVGNWSTTSWAALTWWHAAAASSSAAGDGEPWMPVRVPVLALAGVQLVNFWLARRAQQPVLLSVCVILAGISMACSCYAGQGEPGSVEAAAAGPWTPAVYFSFCAMSVWVLWQELLRSLDI